ncbi:PadR family transcriptional regulator [Streptomyces sp. NPDC001941]|uniref:PadR family transcriptional regulator n=1 Tax=Streptomyces sp. NPDC001941 TaxID=3154659 RepID=UPI003329C303
MTNRQMPKKQGESEETFATAPGRPEPDPAPPAADLPATAWAVLGLLSFPGERTGYDLKKWADASLRFFYWSPAISQVYAELRRLESLGYATSRRSGPEEPRARRAYAITAAGRAALAHWSRTDGCGPAVLKHPLVLRVWLGHLAAPERLRELITHHMAATEAELKEVRDALARAEGVTGWDHPCVALRWSERQRAAELELARAMLDDLAQLGPGLGRIAPEADEPGARQAPWDAPTHG